MVKKHSKIFVAFLIAVFSLTSINMSGIGLLEAWALDGGETAICYDGIETVCGTIKQDDVYMASVSELASIAGANAVINGDSISITYDILDLEVEASAGSDVILVNGSERNISKAPEIVDGAALFPVKDFFYAMNCKVKWDEFDNKFTVNSPLAKVYTSKDIVINKASKSLVIDGSDTDRAWSSADEYSGFSKVFYMDEPESDTSFKVTYDNNNLYLFIRCEGRPVPLEGVSFFVAPAGSIGTDTPYYNALLIPEPENNAPLHDGINRTEGLKIMYAGGLEYTLKKDDGYFAEYNIGETEWTAEVRIPFEKLRPSDDDNIPAPSDKTEWKFNIARVRPYTETASSWAPIRYSIYGDNIIETDMSYSVNFRNAPVTNRTASIIFEEYPETTVFDGISMPYLNEIPENPGMRYMGYTTKLFFFDKPDSLNFKKSIFRAEWENELGKKFDAELVKVFEKNSKLYFLVEHPQMSNEGTYKLNIYIDKDNGNGNGKGKIIGKGNMVQKYEMSFDRQQVIDAGAIYNSFIVDTPVLNKTILENKSIEDISDAAKLMLRIMPETIGYTLNPTPGTGTLSYDAATDSLIKKNGATETFRVTRTRNEDGSYTYSTTPAQYANNGSLTLTSRTGKQVTVGYYDDGAGNRYFLDAQLNGQALNYIKAQLPSLANTDPVGAAYVLYYLAKAYQDWMPKYDYYGSASTMLQWNWGPPFGHFGAIMNRWNFEELNELKTLAPIYNTLRKTNALDIVSQNVSEDAYKVITEDMFNDNVQFFNMYPNQNQNMNYKSWQGLVVLGRNTGNPDYVHQAINMVDEFAKNGFLLDGFWKEVTLSYHTQSLSGINDTINYLKGWSDPAGYISPRTGMNVQNLDMGDHYPVLKAANLVQSTVLYPSGRSFPIQDTWESATGSPQNLGSILLPAANIARMSKGEGSNTKQLYMTFAPGYGSHPHYDPLTLALWSYGQELIPDLGYTHSQLHYWTLSTLGHNTVVVNSKDAATTGTYGGQIENYADIDNTVQIMKASQENAYAGITDEYNREPWYIKMEGSDDSYILDIFRVAGGNRHEYTLSGDGTSKSSVFTTDIALEDYNDYLLPEGTVVTEPTKETEKGSAIYNGEELYYAYAMVRDVKKADLTDGKYEITMSTSDGTANKAGMKITGFAGDNSQLFIGKAPSTSGLSTGTTYQTPKNYMPKMVVRREGADLDSTFVNVMEPYATSSKITSIKKIDTGNGKDVALKVTYPCSSIPGSTITDVLISNSNPQAPITIDVTLNGNAHNEITLNGKMAFVRYLDHSVAKVYIIEAESVTVNNDIYTDSGIGKFEGKVVDTMRKAENDPIDAFVVNAQIPEAVVGKIITVTHPDGSVNGFRIAGVTSDGENSVIEISGGDPGFNIFEDGTSKLLFFPHTLWKGDHTFSIAIDQVFDNKLIVNCTKQSAAYYTSTERQNARNNVNQGYSGAVEEMNNAVTSAEKYNPDSFDGMWSMVNAGNINEMETVLQSLIDAYLYTGDEKYGKAGLILLDRIADIYPDIEITGTLEECGLEIVLAKAYDAFYPLAGSSDVIAFLSNKAEIIGLENPKLYRDMICINIEDRIIRRIRALSDMPEMMDNYGMQQAALAIAAVVLDNPSETTEWLDFVFGEGGNVLAWLENRTNSEGLIEDFSLQQNRIWADMLVEIAEALDGYSGYTGVDLYSNPTFRKLYTAFYSLSAIGKYTIQTGESGEAGVPEIAESIERLAKGYEKTKDPEIARLIYLLNNNSFDNLHYSIFSKNYEYLAVDIIKAFISAGGFSEPESTVLDQGFVILRDGASPVQSILGSAYFNDLVKKEDECTAITKFFPTSGNTTQFEGLSAGATLAYYFELPVSGSCSICFTPYKATSYGIYDIYIDGEKITTMDFYGTTTVNSGIVILPEKYYTSGTHVIKFVCVGKNASASNYKMGVMQLITIQKVTQNDTQRDAWMYYGDTGYNVSHRDQLSLGLHAYGLDLAPDLGASTTDNSQTESAEWISNTISHNTVVVDNSGQQSADNGNLLTFDKSDGIQVMEAESAGAYPQTDLYRRSTVMINVYEQSYFVDIFRIKGGNDHTYSFHSTAGTVTADGLNLIAQSSGTYAGENVEYGTGGYDSGYQWLDSVRKDNAPANCFSLDYDIDDRLNVLSETSDIHLRLTMVGEYDDVAVATGYTPNKESNLDSLEYILVHRTGTDLESVFTSLIEPYENTGIVQAVEEVSVTRDGNAVSEMEAKAIKVTLANGRIDYIISALDSSVTYLVDGAYEFTGNIGVFSIVNGTVITSFVR